MPRYTPTQLWERVERQGGAVDEADRVNQRDYMRWRESWAAARFGLGYERHYGANACLIDIEDQDEQDDYDFQLVVRATLDYKDRERILPFQVAEVMDGHHRNDEYRQLTREQRLAAEAARGGKPEYGLQRLHETIQRKINKHYARSKQLHLLLYLNVNAGRLRYFDLVRASQEQAANFASLWVVTTNDFCRVYCDPQYRNWLRLLHWKPIQG